MRALDPRRPHVTPLSLLAWGLVLARTALAAWDVVLLAGRPTTGANLETVAAVQWALVPVVFGVVGAFVVAHRPDNAVGWLLLAPVAAVGLPHVEQLTEAPADVSFLLLVQLWYVNVAWLLVVFPIMLLLALFPTGRPVGPRWRWHTRLVVGMALVLMAMVAGLERLGPGEGAGDWTVANPIGFLPDLDEGAMAWFLPAWTVGLLTITLGALAAMIVRFRRAGHAERQQLKWLLYAVAVFGTVYCAAALAQGWTQASWPGLLFGAAVMFVPVCLAIAILRHRVFDIDVVIRRTVVYGVVTALLAGVFVGSVVVFQSIAQRLTGADSSVGVAASTLLIAALFDPLRRRTQSLLGKRFFRGSYELERTLAGFGSRVRSETDVDRLWSELMVVVDGALRPEAVSLLLIDGDTDGRTLTTHRGPRGV